MLEGSGTAEDSALVVVSNNEVVSNTGIVVSKETEEVVADGSELEAALPLPLPLLLHPLPPPPPSRHPINR